jgi:hypothetical protein
MNKTVIIASSAIRRICFAFKGRRLFFAAIKQALNIRAAAKPR